MPTIQIADKLIPVVNNTPGDIIELRDSRIGGANPQAGQVLAYNSVSEKYENTNPLTARTVNHEQLSDASRGDANLHDGYYFPNAVQDYDGNWYGAVVIGDQHDQSSGHAIVCRGEKRVRCDVQSYVLHAGK